MKQFKDLDLSDAFLFAATAQDPEACRMILQFVLKREIPEVKVHTEHTILISSDYRMVRLDVYGEDEMKVQYNVEAQNQNPGNLAKRSRFHQAEIDVSSLKPGDDFSALKPSYVIFICTFDPFGQGLYRYTFEPRCLEVDLSLGDDTQRIFFNTRGSVEKGVSRELIQFLHYMENSTDQFVAESTSADIAALHEKVKQVKRNPDLEGKYMTGADWMEMCKAEGLAEGRAEGRIESILAILSVKFAVPEELKEEIMSQTDLEILDRWIVLAAQANSLEAFQNEK